MMVGLNVAPLLLLARLSLLFGSNCDSDEKSSILNKIKSSQADFSPGSLEIYGDVLSKDEQHSLRGKF